MSFALPALVYSQTANNCHLSGLIEKYERQEEDYKRTLAEYKQKIQRLEAERSSLIRKCEATAAKADASPPRHTVHGNGHAAPADDHVSFILPLLVSAYTGNQTLSEQEKRELIKYLEGL